jgi:arylsulfatase A-like enzyme
MLTGLHPCQHGATGKNRLRQSVPTLAEIVQNNGYRTGGFVSNPQVGELVGFDRGHETFCEVWRGTKSSTIIDRGFRFIRSKVLERFHRVDKGASKSTTLVIDWLKDRTRTSDPFYIFIHFIEPHNPLNPPEPFRSNFLRQVAWNDIDFNKVKRIAYNPLICLTDNLTPTPEELGYLKALYDAEIAYTDSQIKRIVDFLKWANIYDQTLIIVTSDHGEHFGEHGLYSHVSSLYEPVLRVPLIMRYPDAFRKGTRDKHLVQLIDIFPTVIDLAKIDSESTRHIKFCRSLTNSEGAFPYHDFIVAEWEGRVPYYVERRTKETGMGINMDLFTNKLAMIRQDNYKYILASDGGQQLYDLESDKTESKNLASERREVVARLHQKLDEWRELVSHDQQQNEEQARMDEEIARKLKSLGYL